MEKKKNLSALGIVLRVCQSNCCNSHGLHYPVIYIYIYLKARARVCVRACVCVNVVCTYAQMGSAEHSKSVNLSISCRCIRDAEIDIRETGQVNDFFFCLELNFGHEYAVKYYPKNRFPEKTLAVSIFNTFEIRFFLSRRREHFVGRDDVTSLDH